MPEKLKNKCGVIIHTASVATASFAALPVPIADTIPITATQATMIISLGKVFDITIDDSVGKAIATCTAAQTIGRTLVSALKVIPGINVLGIAINIAVAPTVTETMGWAIANDFYNISIGSDELNFFSKVPDLLNIIIGSLGKKKNVTKRIKSK